MLAKNVIDLVMNGLNMFFQILPESSFEVTSFTSKIHVPVMNNSYMKIQSRYYTEGLIASKTFVLFFFVDMGNVSFQNFISLKGFVAQFTL